MCLLDNTFDGWPFSAIKHLNTLYSYNLHRLINVSVTQLQIFLTYE